MRGSFAIISALALMIGSTQAFASDNAFVSDNERSDLLSIRSVTENSTDELGLLNALVKANAYQQDNECEKAARIYAFILKYDPNLEDAILGLVQCLIKSGEFEQAMSVLDKTDILSDEMNILRIMAQAQSLNVSERIAFLKSNASDFSESRLYNLLGESYLTKGLFDQAQESFIRAHQSGQDKGILENNLGILHLRSGNTSRAVSYFSMAKALMPTEPRFENNHRFALILNGQYAAALDGVSSEDAHEILFKAGLIAERKGEIRLAEMLLEEAINLSPSYYKAAEMHLEKLRSGKLD